MNSGFKTIRAYLLLTLVIIISAGCSNKFKKEAYEIKKGDLQASITETGTLEAINSKMIAMPFLGWRYGWRFKIVKLEEHGARVDKGEEVVAIDPSPVVKVLEEEQNRLETEQANLNKMLASHKSQISQIISERDSEKANYELIKLQVEKFKFEPQGKQNIKQLELDIAEIKLEQINNKLALKKTVFENEKKIQRIKLEQISKNIYEAKKALNKLSLESPYNGIFQLEQNRRTRKTIQLGDEVHQGQNIASIPDLSSMKILSVINETDIKKVNLKQDVVLRLEAYPEKPFKGEISYIGRFSHEKDDNNPVKVFDIEITVLEDNEALKPGMTVTCDIITHDLKDIFYIENECLFHDSAGVYLYEKGIGTHKSIPVKVLARNTYFSAITGDVEQGQRMLTQLEMRLEENK